MYPLANLFRFINADKIQYLRSLRARSKKSGPASKSKGKKKHLLPLLDLDRDGDEHENEDEEGDSDLMEKEKKQLELLEKALSGCVRCGPEKFCKIDKSGNHVNLTFNQ
jgi:hypothetical protein